MDNLVRLKVSHLLISVVVLLALSLANLGLSIATSGNTDTLIKGQKTIEEKVTPLCLSSQTVEACKRQIDAAKLSVVTRLCKIVHLRLHLPRAECERFLAAAVKRNAASANGSRSPPSRSTAGSGAAGTRGPTNAGTVSPGSAGPTRHPHPGHSSPPAAGPSPVAPAPAPAPDGPGNSENSKGQGAVKAEAHAHAGGAGADAIVEVPPLVPEDTGKAVGKAVDEAGNTVGKAVGQLP